MPDATYQLTFSALQPGKTLQQIERFLDFLTKSSAGLSALEMTNVQYNEETFSLQVTLSGPDHLVERLHYHMQTYFKDYKPTLVKLLPEDLEPL